MCNLNKAIYRDGKQEGRLKGKLEGGKKANIRTICKMLVDDMPAKKIIQFVDMDEEVVRQIIELVHGNTSCDDSNIDRIYSELNQKQAN